MALSLWNKFTKVSAEVAGNVRSSVGLIALLAIICLLFAALLKDVLYVPGAAFVLFAGIVVVVMIRYSQKGPEFHRVNSTFLLSQHEFQIHGHELGILEHPEFSRALTELVVRFRQPLPLPSGILEGPASNPSSIRELTAEEAKCLTERDNSVPQGNTQIQLHNLPAADAEPPSTHPKPSQS